MIPDHAFTLTPNGAMRLLRRIIEQSMLASVRGLRQARAEQA